MKNGKDMEKEIIEAANELVEAVEKYIRQDCLRSTLVWKKENLKRLLEAASATKQNGLLNFKPEGLEIR